MLADHGHLRKLSFAVLFADIVAVFPLMNRRLSVGSDIADDVYIPDDSGYVRFVFTGVRIWESTVTPVQLRRIMMEMFHSTWAAIEGLSGVLAYVMGTSTRTSLADIIFIAAMLRCLHRSVDTWMPLS